MKDKKSTYGTVKLNAFETTIKWFVGDFNEFVSKYKLKDWELRKDCAGLTLVCEKYILIYSDIEDTNNTIPHEVVHAVARMAEHRDILFDGTNHEMIAYLVGYISGKILNKLKLNNYGTKR